MEGSATLALPPPHKMRKDKNGKQVISITPAMLQELLERQRKRKALDENLKSNLENICPESLKQDNTFTVSNKLPANRRNFQNFGKVNKQIIKVRPLANKQQPLSEQSKSNVSCSQLEAISKKMVPINVTILDPKDLPSPVEDINRTSIGFEENGLISKPMSTYYESDCHQVPFVGSFETVSSEENPEPRVDIENFFDTLSKENTSEVEDEISKMRTMLPLLQQTLFSTFNIAGKLLDKNYLLNTGRKRIDSDKITPGILTKRLLGFTSVLNCLETHLMSRIECLQQTILTQKFLPEAEIQPNFIESLSKMDTTVASDKYKKFLSTAESQILFTNKLQQLIEDAARINT